MKEKKIIDTFWTITTVWPNGEYVIDNDKKELKCGVISNPSAFVEDLRIQHLETRFMVTNHKLMEDSFEPMFQKNIHRRLAFYKFLLKHWREPNVARRSAWRSFPEISSLSVERFEFLCFLCHGISQAMLVNSRTVRNTIPEYVKQHYIKDILVRNGDLPIETLYYLSGMTKAMFIVNLRKLVADRDVYRYGKGYSIFPP